MCSCFKINIACCLKANFPCCCISSASGGKKQKSKLAKKCRKTEKPKVLLTASFMKESVAVCDFSNTNGKLFVCNNNSLFHCVDTDILSAWCKAAVFLSASNSSCGALDVSYIIPREPKLLQINPCFLVASLL